HDLSVLHRLAVRLPDHNQVDERGLKLRVFLPGKSRGGQKRERKASEGQTINSHDYIHSTASRLMRGIPSLRRARAHHRQGVQGQRPERQPGATTFVARCHSTSLTFCSSRATFMVSPPELQVGRARRVNPSPEPEVT